MWHVWFCFGILGGHLKIHTNYVDFQHEFPESFLFHNKVLYVESYSKLVIKRD